MKRLELAFATMGLGLGGAPTRPPVAEMAMHPYLVLEGLGKGVEIEAQSKAKLLARSIGKWCGDGGATRWQWRAQCRPCGCESEGGRGNERERADGRVVAGLKPSPARLVGLALVYDCQMVSMARVRSATTGPV